MTPSPAPKDTAEQEQEPVQQYAEDEPQEGWLASLQKRMPAWMKQLPERNIPTTPDPTFQLINDKMLDNIQRIHQLDATSIQRIKDDRKFMETELMRYFRELDADAKVKQNNYRLYQIRILVLATIATLVGSLQAVSLDNESALRFFGLLEGIVALFAVFIIQTRGTDSTLPGWLTARKKAEQLRREYFRFMLRLPPYDREMQVYDLKLKLSSRAAEIYNDQDPEEPSILEGDVA